MDWLRQQIIVKLGGYVDVDSALESVNVKDKYHILTLATKRLFNTIGPDDILKVSDAGQWMLEGRPLSEGDKNLLIAEAHYLLDTKLWKVLQLDIKYQSNRKMYLLAQSEIDIIAGKMWQYTLDAIKTRLHSMKAGKGTFSESHSRQ
jgi:hypothetical protein